MVNQVKIIPQCIIPETVGRIMFNPFGCCCFSSQVCRQRRQLRQLRWSWWSDTVFQHNGRILEFIYVYIVKYLTIDLAASFIRLWYPRWCNMMLNDQSFGPQMLSRLHLSCSWKSKFSGGARNRSFIRWVSFVWIPETDGIIELLYEWYVVEIWGYLMGIHTNDMMVWWSPPKKCA